MFSFGKKQNSTKVKLFEAVDDSQLEAFKEIFYSLSTQAQQKQILSDVSTDFGRNLLHTSCLQGNFKIT